MESQNTIKISASIRQEVTVDMAEAIRCIKASMGFDTVRGEHFIVKNGVLLHGEDVSYHGSPMYEYREISNNPNFIAVYNSLKLLEEYFNDRDAPKWAKHIEVSPGKEKKSVKSQLVNAPGQEPKPTKNNMDKGAR